MVSVISIEPSELIKLKSPALVFNMLYWHPDLISHRTKFDQTLEYYYNTDCIDGVKEALLGIGLKFKYFNLSKKESENMSLDSYISNPLYRNYINH